MSVKIQFLGAIGFVTGSSYLVTYSGGKFLVDCGLYQGGAEAEQHNEEEFQFDPRVVDFVILTHAHLDHCGLLPKLAASGFDGAIYSTQPTKELANIVMSDAAHIQENGAHEDQVEVLFSQTDVEKALSQFKTYPYDQEIEVKADVKIRFRDAGHILGSSCVEIWVDGKKLTFSGDLGNYSVPIMNNPATITESDYVICESTYGDRLHEPPTNRTTKLKDLIIRTANQGLKTLIPVFAIERTQDILFQFDELFNDPSIPKVKTYLDSPMAIKTTEVYKQHLDLFDQAFRQFENKDRTPFDFSNLTTTAETAESKALNDQPGPMIIMAGSGMADAGRIVHHLRNNLANPKTIVVFVGYQVPGTLGRRLMDGVKEVKMFGEIIPVKAKIESIDSFSAHADQDGLIAWLKGFTNKPKIFITHGEDASREGLQTRIQNELGNPTQLPELFEEIEL